MRDEVFLAESETAIPLQQPSEHARHALNDIMEAINLENSDSPEKIEKQTQLLNEVEGHFISMGIYAWEEMAATELLQTKEDLEQSKIKGKKQALEKYTRAAQKYASARSQRSNPKTAIDMFKESCNLAREDARVYRTNISNRNYFILDNYSFAYCRNYRRISYNL